MAAGSRKGVERPHALRNHGGGLRPVDSAFGLVDFVGVGNALGRLRCGRQAATYLGYNSKEAEELVQDVAEALREVKQAGGSLF